VEDIPKMWGWTLHSPQSLLLRRPHPGGLYPKQRPPSTHPNSLSSKRDADMEFSVVAKTHLI